MGHPPSAGRVVTTEGYGNGAGTRRELVDVGAGKRVEGVELPAGDGLPVLECSSCGRPFVLRLATILGGDNAGERYLWQRECRHTASIARVRVDDGGAAVLVDWR